MTNKNNNYNSTSGGIGFFWSTYYCIYHIKIT